MSQPIVSVQMQNIIPNKLIKGDEVRVIAPSMSMAILSQNTKDIANQRLKALDLHLSFGQHVMVSDVFSSSSIEERLEDLHAAFRDKNVKAILTVIGGYNVNQLLEHIDYDLIKNNPKILCGYSDITALQNAIYAKTGLVSYSGPHYSTLGMETGLEWSLDYLKKCLFSSEPFMLQPSKQWSDDAWYLDQKNRHFMPNDGFWLLQKGRAEGVILGANLCTFNLLKGTSHMPNLEHTILFLEEDSLTKNCTGVVFDRDLQSLTQQSGFDKVRALVIGRFQKASEVSFKLLQTIIKNKKELSHLPIIANVDFGHTDPMVTFPIGGRVRVVAEEGSIQITIIEH